MTPASPSSPARNYPRPLREDIQLPRTDVRSRFNQRALRNWNESSRRAVRVATLMASDMVAGVAGVWLLEATWSVVSGGGRRPLPDQVPLLAMVFCLQPLAMRVTGAYAGGKARVDLVRIAGGVAIAALLGWVQAQLFGRDVPALPNKAAYLYAAAVVTVLAWVLRSLINLVVSTGYSIGMLQRRVLVVGSRAEADALSRSCEGIPGCEFRIVGRLSVGESDRVVASLDHAVSPRVPYSGTVDDLEDALTQSGAQGLIVASNLSFGRMEALAGQCFRLGATVAILPRALKRLSAGEIEVRPSAMGSLLHLRPVRLEIPQLAVKRLMDLTVTLAALLVLWPLLLIIAALIKVDSRGPVLFGQMRAGIGGQPFRMLKFRTMRVGADAEKASLAGLNESGDPRLFKIKRDPRVTRTGRLLRRTSLDELPQLVNVLRGEMSLVGPRPFFPGDLDVYERHHFERLHVLPGITGLWQVSGRSAVMDFEEVIRLDRSYIEHWSVLTDVHILLRTIPAAFGRGAY